MGKRISFNSIDFHYKVEDEQGFPFGDGETILEALESMIGKNKCIITDDQLKTLIDELVDEAFEKFNLEVEV